MHNAPAPELRSLSKIILRIRGRKMSFNPERRESVLKVIASKRGVSH